MGHAQHETGCAKCLAAWLARRSLGFCSMKNRMRIYHRYLGFFLSGIMAVYALSGMIMIFRNTDFLKVETKYERQLSPGLSAAKLGEEIKIRRLKGVEDSEQEIVFAEGVYNKETGQASYTLKALPVVLKKMEDMHKATSDQPLFYLNLFFGASLLFFVVSSFFMFLPKSKTFRYGIYYAVAGLGLTVVMVYL